MSMSGLSAWIVGLLLLTGTLDAAPYQELEHREGFVPVYIREGNTPLVNVNLKLAEAFNEIDLLERSELGNKPDLILMSADNNGAMLIARPGDQVMSEAEPVMMAIVPTEAAIPQLSADATKTINNAQQGEEPQAVINTKLQEETKEAIKDLVDVLEVDMLEKLKDAVTEEPVAIEKKSGDDKQLEAEQVKKEVEEEVAQVAEVIPQQPEAPAAPAPLAENAKLIAEVKPEEQPTDVLTVEDFKTKEIDVKSIETEKIDVPEDKTPDTKSTDE